jgi:M6 family metalloprotease-like protein
MTVLLARRRAVWLLAVAGVLFVAGVLGARATPAASKRAKAVPVRTTPTSEFGAWGDFVLPADTTITLTQPNGTTLAARLTQAEIGGDLEVDGYTVVKGDDKWWRYATGRDKNAKLIASDARAGVDARPAGLAPGAGRSRNVWDDGAGGDVRAQVFALLREASRQAQVEANAAGEPRLFRFPVLMLATWWDPEKGQSMPTFQEGNTAEHFNKILDGFGGNPTGSLTEFYFENSFGQFLVDVDVFGPFTSVRSIEDRCYYGNIEPTPVTDGDLDPTDSVLGIGGLGAAGMAIEAVPQADPSVDFAPYDNDGDGYVDFVGIIHSGPDMAVTGDPCNTWSHALPFSVLIDIAESVAGLPDLVRGGLPTLDGVIVDRLFTMPEFDEPGGQLNIGVATHEMGHALGEIDFYNVPDTSEGTGEWDIMAASGYMGRPIQSNPTGFNPSSRVFQGWVTPTVVHDDVRDVVLRPRNILPKAGYSYGEPDPNLVLVPVKWIKPGQTDELGHVWTDRDVFGLHLDGDRGYVLEGYYLEYISRTARAAPLTDKMTRSPYFDRAAHGSGLLTWHFDYYKRGNVLFGSNNGQDDDNRYQMDVEEWDFNDNTQELQLDTHRGEVSDVARDAAAGITSGTRQLSPIIKVVEGEPQAGLEFSGTVTPVAPDTFEFEVEDNPANGSMTVRAGSSGDCTLTVYKEGTTPPGSVDSGGGGDVEEFTITKPAPGTWIAEVGDFLLCLNYTGTVSFSSPNAFDTKGAADTWSNWTAAPTGWAFTNIRTGPSQGVSFATEAGDGDDQTLTLDIVNIGAGEVDVAPGFAVPIENSVGGRDPVNAGRDNVMRVPVFNSGGAPASAVSVVVREGSAAGRTVATGTLSLAAYQRGDFEFAYRPAAEGPYDLYVTVDPANTIAEVVEGNNTQHVSGWAGPADAAVLVVDDDGAMDAEDAFTGALAALGVPYAVATRHVDAATMRRYEAVIWSSAVDRENGQLDQVDRREIISFLDGGGKMWLSSNRASDALTAVAEDTFLAKYFGATIQEVETYDKPIAAKSTGDILGSLEFGLQPYAGRAFVDFVTVAEEGAGGTVTPILAATGALKPGDEGKLMGLRLEGGAFKSVLTTFNLSQASSYDGAVAVTRSVLSFFGVAGGRYAAGGREPLIFHSQPRLERSGTEVPVRAIVLGGAAGQSVTLHYRRHGLGGYYRVEMQRGSEPGSYVAVIPPEAVTPDGIDYFLQVGNGAALDPSLAAGRRGAHVIAVAVPEVGSPAAILAADQGGAPTVGDLPATGGRSGAPAVLVLIAAFVLHRRLRRRAPAHP